MATAAATYIPETLKLQLRKPKSWNWELSTSKSSPNIILPIIQLYDYRGHLLIEAKDTSSKLENKWHSSDFVQPTSRSRSRRSRSIQRSRSDTMQFYPNQTDRTREKQSKLDAVKKTQEIESQNENKNEPTLKNADKYKELEKRRHKRSKSDDLFRRKLRYNSSEESMKRAEIDGYKNFINLNKSSSTNLTKNHEDTIKKNYENENIKPSKNHRSRNRNLCTADDIKLDINKNNLELENFLHNKRYTTRTCSAGTLIIPEESFKNKKDRCRRNRRRCTDTHLMENFNQNSSSKSNLQEKQQLSSSKKHLRQTSDPTTLLSQEKLAEYAFVNVDPVKKRNYSSIYPHCNIYYTNSNNNQQPFSKLLINGNTVYSDVNCNTSMRNFNNNNNNNNNNIKCDEFKDCIKGQCYNKNDNKINESNRSVSYRDYSLIDVSRQSSVCEIVEIVSDDNENGNCNDDKSDVGDTDCGDEIRDYIKKGHLIREHSAEQHEKQKNSAPVSGAIPIPESKDANVLLKLVRKLSYSDIRSNKTAAHELGHHDQQVEEDEINMGANVSRHSSKGLGRRSQSSGSIYNENCPGSSSRGNKHPDGTTCSSLPSYLDDQEKNGACNNNHDKKPSMNEDRIPPIGDNASLHWKFCDTQIICDQGYGSERSPEEEYPPPLNSLDQENLQCLHHLEPHACYPFITPESTFTIKLTKGSRGLGLSVTGGIDSAGSWPGLIRIKRLFPHQPASSCGLLNIGDLLLEANKIPLTGLTNYEALEVLRTASNQVELKVCRPPPDVLSCVSPISEVPPPPPRREPPNLEYLEYKENNYNEFYNGEFEITLKKVHGSLGFTLRKEDDSALGHYVRALVREPALTDGRIKAGDKIIAVNDVEICSMSHEEAVQFLRQCGEVVKLRLYRDSAQTPVATLSPTETTPRGSFNRKAHLRPEAVEMLNDLAGRKLVGMNSEIFSESPTSSPRHVRQTPCHFDNSQVNSSCDYADYQEQFHEGIIQKFPRPFDEDAFNSLFSMESEDSDRPNRPSSLELYNPNQTPVASRKPRFNFSLAHNAYELNNLDAEVLDAPNLKYNLGNEDIKTSDSEVQEPVSMPHISTNSNTNFSHKNPAYQSAHPQINSDNEQTQPTKVINTTSDKDNTLGRRKKSVPENKEVVKANINPQRHPLKEEYEVLAIELNRGWNSRLGFSLQGAAGVTYVSAVHADSVAARDGRLKPGDRIIKVNDESIEHMSTSEIIDLLRIVRGPVCIVVSRLKPNEDCQKRNANAEN